MNINWHGNPCPQEYLATVEAELAGLLRGMLDSPQQLISHRMSLGNGGAVTAWGETGDDAFHAEYYDGPTKARADESLLERIRQLFKA